MSKKTPTIAETAFKRASGICKKIPPHALGCANRFAAVFLPCAASGAVAYATMPVIHSSLLQSVAVVWSLAVGSAVGALNLGQQNSFMRDCWDTKCIVRKREAMKAHGEFIALAAASAMVLLPVVMSVDLLHRYSPPFRRFETFLKQSVPEMPPITIKNGKRPVMITSSNPQLPRPENK